jgi:hypothetical protein
MLHSKYPMILMIWAYAGIVLMQFHIHFKLMLLVKTE